MKRYYISPVTMQASADLLGETIPVVKAATYPGFSGATKVALGPNNELLIPWALVILAGIDHTAPQADASLTSFPDLSLDATVGTLAKRQRDAFFAGLNKHGIDTSWITLQTTFRQVLEYVGNLLVPNFSSNAFDAKEPA